MIMGRIADTYYAKILLFGEYTVILGSRALSIPFTHFRGGLAFVGDEQYTDLNFATRSNRSLAEYAVYLEEQVKEGHIPARIDTARLREDIGKGLFFESSIPPGYGVGSSGALVAALYRNYSLDPILPRRSMSLQKILRLRALFALMEAYFHGTSSGLDPLICYLRFPLLIEGKQSVRPVSIPRPGNAGDGAIFLLDTGIQGKTGPLVDHFLKQCQDPAYRKKIDQELIPLNNACIRDILDGEIGSFFSRLRQLSAFQLEHFSPMIPGIFPEYWRKGLETDRYYLKLLGSGGGGYILGFTRDYPGTSLDFQELGKEIIPVYRTKK